MPEEETVITEAASEIQAIRNNEAVELLRSCLPRMTDQEREERERWRSPKGPGRPRVAPDRDYPSMPIQEHHAGLGHYIGTKARTGRGRQNAQYAGRAMSALFEHREAHPEVLELTGLQTLSGSMFGPGGDAPGLIQKGKNIGVLAELGRLICRYENGTEVAVAWAVELARMEPRLTSKQAVAWLRQRRLQKSNLGNAGDLLDTITRAIDGYLANHPGTSQAAIVEALQWAVGIFEPEDEATGA